MSGWLFRSEAPPLPEFYERKLRLLERKVRAASPNDYAQAFVTAASQALKWPGREANYDTLRYRFRDLADEVGLIDVVDDLIERAEEAAVRSRPAPYLSTPVAFDPKPFILRDPAKTPRRQWLYGAA